MSDNALTLERLREYPFFTSLPDVILHKLQPNVFERSFAPRELVLRLGDYSDAAYYVRDGSVEIHLTVQPRKAAELLTDAPARDTAASVGTIGAGESFGP